MNEPQPILLDFPDRLTTNRLVIRRYHPGDGAAVYDAVTASIEHLKVWMPWAHEEQTLEKAEALVRSVHANWTSPRTDLGMGIWDRSESRLLGGTGLHRIDWRVRVFEIGYWIRPTEEGKGLVTESTRELCRFAFSDLGANRVHIRCAASNIRSAAIPRRLGFLEEGTLLNALMLPNGSLVDCLSFGLTPEMWNSRK